LHCAFYPNRRPQPGAFGLLAFQRSLLRHVLQRKALGYVFIGDLAERFLLAARVLAKDNELGRFDGRRNPDTLRASRLWAPGGRAALLSAYRRVVVRAHAKAFGRNRQRRRRA
jgi:hypothetical protein